MDRAVVTVLLAGVLVVSASPVGAHGNHIEADAQRSANGTVVVETVLPLVDGFVVLHESTESGEPGDPIGHTRVSAADGFRRGVNVQMDADAWANWSDGDEVWIVYHEDNGATTFDPAEDPSLSVFGSITGTSVPLARADREASLLAERTQPQRTANATATLGRVALGVDGYAVLRTASGTDGQIVGVTPLDAGVNENVTVDFDASAFPEDRSTVGFYAQLYAETGANGGNETAAGEFSAADDELVRVGGEPVGSYFLVRRVDDTADSSPVVQTPTQNADEVVTPTAAGGQPVTPTAASSGVDGSTTAGVTTDAATGASGSSVPGFGVGAAVVALLAAALVLARRS